MKCLHGKDALSLCKACDFTFYGDTDCGRTCFKIVATLDLIEADAHLGRIKGQLAELRETSDLNFQDLIDQRVVNQSLRDDLEHVDCINEGLEKQLTETRYHLGVLAQEVCDNQQVIEGATAKIADLRGALEIVRKEGLKYRRMYYKRLRESAKPLTGG